MKQVIRQSFSLKLLVVLLTGIVIYSCKKSDRISETSASDAPSLLNAQRSPKPSEESADVVYQWYRFISVLQRPVTPQPVVFTQARAFAYIGIGLFESVQPGINGGSSFGPKLYQMPVMPKPDQSKELFQKKAGRRKW